MDIDINIDINTEPKMINQHGDRIWFLHGKRHRDDGPAVKDSDDCNYWYQHGHRHREDGPSVECPDGYRGWYLYGELHREDGPAREWRNGYREWYLHGELKKTARSIECFIKSYY